MIRYPQITGVVLAGGRARRMGGVNKAMLPARPGSTQTTLARILEVFNGRFADCLLVTAADGSDAHVSNPANVAKVDKHAGDPAVWYAGLDVRRVADRHAGCGPLGGLEAALSVVQTPFAFVCGCDMPSLSGGLLDLMAGRVRPGRLLVPVVAGRPEPLHAVYPRSCLPVADEALREGVRMMLDFFQRVEVDYLHEDEFAGIEDAAKSFHNINSPEDLETQG
ncbi:MAG TPA: molybdenum cofactor guanylyltransferase [Patescibacteria group bacterium]|nr:molybdenum cofactor guanylyltransferase [Patescibacteria group bacterium]